MSYPRIEKFLKVQLSIYSFIILVMVCTASSLYAESLAPISKSTQFSIALINPLSGVYQEYGQECQAGYQLALSDYPDLEQRGVAFLTEDDQSTPKMTVSAFQKVLAAEGELLSVHVFSSAFALPVNPLSEANKVPLIAVASHPKFVSGNPYAISSWREATHESEKFVNAFVRDAAESVAMLSFENDYTLAVRDYVKAGLSDKNISVVFDEIISDQVDYRALLPKLLSKKPDTIFLNVLGPSYSQLVKQLYELGYRGKKYSLNANARGSFIKAAGVEASEGIRFFGPDYYQPFFTKHFVGKDLSEGYSNLYVCYLGLSFVLSEVEQLLQSGTLSRELLSKQLLSATEFKVGGVALPVKDRRILYEFSESEVKNGKFVQSK
jgi:ABC-type branched-subunit amino acid transport system substrate-binding protein